MNINNKTQIRRGVNFADKKSSALSLEWASAVELEGGDLCALITVSGEAKFNKMDPTTLSSTIVTNLGGSASTHQTKIDAVRDFIYICWQGADETENEFFPISDTFVKIKDCYFVMELKDVSAAQWATAAVGDCLVVDDNGFIGTKSITADNTSTDALSFDGSHAVNISGTQVVAVNQDTDGDYLITVVC